MGSFLKQRVYFFSVVILLTVVCGRVLWLLNTDQLRFETSLAALFPSTNEQSLEQEIEQRLSTELEDRIVILVIGQDIQQSMHVTDLLIDGIEADIESGEIQADIFYGVDQEDLSRRISLMSKYRDRLIADKSALRITQSAGSQLRVRKAQAEQFPPSNLTSLTLDPLGTLEEYLLERMPKLKGVSYDGLYFRLENDVPGILLIVGLVPSGLGGTSANKSTNKILERVRELKETERVDIHVSGFPIHASEIRNKTAGEIMWMSVLAASFTLFYFLFVTRSILALVSSITMIMVAIAGAVALSQVTVGLPHLIGLTMATTAIGICIDFSFHFWVHVKSGLNGAQTIKEIKGGLNMGFITTAVGLVTISFVSVPVLARSAIFILGALFISWIFVLVVLPRCVTKTLRGGNTPNSHTSKWEFKKSSLLFLVLIVFIASSFLISNYHTDDSPSRLGQKIERLAEQDRVVQKLLGSNSGSKIFLVSAETPESLLLTESMLMRDLDAADKTNVRAISRLVPDSEEQYENRNLYQRSLGMIDSVELRDYLKFLKISDSDFRQHESSLYSLELILEKEWADIERNMVLDCQPQRCSSMVRASGIAAEKLDKACYEIAGCRTVSLSTMKEDAFFSLRASLSWALVVAGIAMFLMLYVRYRFDAFKLMLVPVLACFSGVAAVSALNMPITTFTLAALFPLLGLSIDYVVFVKESSEKIPLTLKAVSASAVTTTISFFILTFSGTPAVQFFAIPVAVGIPVAWMFVQTSWFRCDR